MFSVLSTKEIRRTMIFQCYLLDLFFIWEIPISLASSLVLCGTFKGENANFQGLLHFQIQGPHNYFSCF